MARLLHHQLGRKKVWVASKIISAGWWNHTQHLGMALSDRLGPGMAGSSLTALLELQAHDGLACAGHCSRLFSQKITYSGYDSCFITKAAIME